MTLLNLKFITDIKDNDYEVVEFHGELDSSTIPDAEKRIFGLLADYKRDYLVFDLADLNYINSEGIGFVITAQMKLAKKKQKLLLCGVRPNVAEVFDLIGVPKLVQVFPNISEAIKFIKTSRI